MEPTFDTLARQHRRALYAAARRCSGNAEDAEDLTQEALCLAYRYFHRFQPGTNFLAWVGRIMTRLAIRRYHQRSRWPEIVSMEELPPQWEDGLPAPPNDDLYPEQHLLARVADETVRSQIQALPEPFQRVMLLCCLEDLPYDEISHRLRIPIGTVRSRLFRGRRLLRDALSSLCTAAEAGPSAGAHAGLPAR
jgi:RNA polymerase sigma-70 factor (ECF subfamily)